MLTDQQLAAGASGSGEDIQIEIEYEDREAAEEQKRACKTQYESELRDVAKYLVDEITKISVNKLKIDNLNETLDKKYFANDLVTKHEILANLVEEVNTDNTLSLAETKQIDSIKQFESKMENKSREELFDYYTKLEKNLQQVRNEIDNLKREAFEDLKYINEILTTTSEPMQSVQKSSGVGGQDPLIDVDQVYLRNDDMVETVAAAPTQNQHEVISASKRANKVVEEEEEDETQYLSQPASSVNETFNDSSCQIYLTPAGSWQTLTNLNLNLKINVNNNGGDNDTTLINNNNNMTPQQLTPVAGVKSYANEMDDNKTDLDEQEFDEYERNAANNGDTDDETETTIRYNGGGVSPASRSRPGDLIYTKTTQLVNEYAFFSFFFFNRFKL